MDLKQVKVENDSDCEVLEPIKSGPTSENEVLKTVKVEKICDFETMKPIKVEHISDSEATEPVNVELISDCGTMKPVKIEPDCETLESDKGGHISDCETMKPVKIEPECETMERAKGGHISDCGTMKMVKAQPVSVCETLEVLKGEQTSDCKTLESVKSGHISVCETVELVKGGHVSECQTVKQVNVEHVSDCEDSDDSIELTDDDKNYIEKLMVERYGFKTNPHREKFKCVMPCHICDKIELSANPASTNTFLDFIFMEHENDFAFTKEKRQKIIQSLVSEYFATETKKNEGVKPRKIKVGHSNITRIRPVTRILALKRFNRYSATPLRTRKPPRIHPVRKELHSKNIKLHEKSNHYIDRPIAMVKKLKPHPQSNKYNTYHNIKATTQTPDEIKRTKYVNRAQSPSKTVLKIEVKPNSVIRKVEPQERQSHKYKADPLKILENKPTGTFEHSRDPRIKNINSFKTARNVAPEPEIKFASVIRRVEPKGKENEFLPKARPVRKPKFVKSQVSCNAEVQKQQEQQPPMKDPTSPFYIPEDYMDIALYQHGLAFEGWNPTQVLYEICGYCTWGKPEFLEGGNVLGGFLCCVRIKGFSFMARSRGQTKKIARHLASTYFLNTIGFKFFYNIHSHVPLKSIDPYSDERFVFPRGINKPGVVKY